MTTTSPRSAPIERPPWLPWSRYPFPTRFMDVDGTLVHYADEGAGPTLLFVSAGQWSFIFRDVILELRDRFRCLALDFPGCGLSAPAPDGGPRSQ